MREFDPTVSETSRVRDLILPYIQPRACGLDLGYGGDCIAPQVMAMDSWAKYTNFKNDPQHLYGDARELHWFRDGVLDAIHSSHLLEDFPDPRPLLQEWLRVIKPGGLLSLYLPNEKRYRAHCDATGQSYNFSHQCLEMSLEYMLPIVESFDTRSLYTRDEPEGYGFLILAAKPMYLNGHPDDLRSVEVFGERVKPFVVRLADGHPDGPAIGRWLMKYGYTLEGDEYRWLPGVAA